MKILVTGGAGFIGSHVVQALLNRGDEVVVVDNINDYYDVQLKKDRLKMILQEVTFYELDIADLEGMRKVFFDNKIDQVCHLAAQAGVRYSLENPFAYEKANNVGTLNILELMKEFGVKDLVYASSSSVYGGNKKTPFSVEDNVDRPVSLYAATKKYNELIAHVYHHLYGLNCLGLRFFTVYGPLGRPDMALFKFTKAILEDKPIDVYNFGNMKRDFTFITDIVDGVVRSLDRVSEVKYSVLNLGNSNTVQLNRFIEIIEKELGKKAERNLMPLQPGDVPETFADIEKTKEVLSWEPKVGIEEGIKKFIDWYKGYYSKNYYG
ncbi:NAD-dependent epimerase/dehydratase family protein [Candidatus Woesearchaeota archaeon]|nr:NAD-dependent epimerase/dehydratase family protein [Candidatus Woesearchaeota archaeon]